MIISSRTQKALSVIAITLVVALVMLHVVGAVWHASPDGSVAAHVGATTSPYRDPFDGGYHAARGRLLWQEEMQPHPICIHQQAAQHIPINDLDMYATDNANGRFAGGSHIARIVRVKLGVIPFCA